MEGTPHGPQEDQPPQPPAAQGRPQRSVRRRPSRHKGAVDRVREVQFPIALRGYDRAAVDSHLAEIAQLVAELEATQLREGVVQRALDEVGEQTSGILQHAHDTAEEIASRSRAQAEGRVQRADREAELIRREADNYAEQVAADTRRLTEERRKLIEELRQYAEDVLNVADDALERLPELLGEAPEEQRGWARPGPEPGPGSRAEEQEPREEPQEASQQPTQQLPARSERAPSPEPAADPDDFVEGVIRVERRPKSDSG